MDKRAKDERIGSLFKILALKEDLDQNLITNQNYKTYILNQYNIFVGYDDMDEDMQNKIVSKLRGLYKICDELNQKEIKSIVFKMTNLIARGE